MMMIINPSAGKGNYRNEFPEAMRLLSSENYVPCLYYTKKQGDAGIIASEYAKEYDVVVCLGGDGTLSDTLGGLMKLDDPPPVGYIPMGTANDVATTLSLPKNDVVAAVRKLIGGEAHPYDLGGFGKDKFFSYIAAFGAFTEVSYNTPQNQKKVLGHLAYILQGAASLPRIEPIHARVEFDDGVIDTNLIYGSMSNSTSVAGIVHLREEMVSLGDGVSELVLVKDPGDVSGLSKIIDSVLTKRFDSDKLIILHTKRAKFTFDKPIAWTRDGENGGEYEEIELCNYKAPIKMIF